MTPYEAVDAIERIDLRPAEVPEGIGADGDVHRVPAAESGPERDQLDDEPAAKSGPDGFAHQADRLASGPGVDDVRAASVGKSAAGGEGLGVQQAAKLRRAMVAQRRLVVGHRENARVARPGQLGGEGGHLQGTVGGEIAM